MVIKPAVAATWGLNPKSIQWIYNAIVLPKLTYGAHAWYQPSKMTQGLSNKLSCLSRLMLQYYAPFFRNTPTESLEVLYNHVPPLIEILCVGMSTHCRIRNSVPTKWDGQGTTKGQFKGFLLQWDLACSKVDWLDGSLPTNQSDQLCLQFQNWDC